MYNDHNVTTSIELYHLKFIHSKVFSESFDALQVSIHLATVLHMFSENLVGLGDPWIRGGLMNAFVCLTNSTLHGCISNYIVLRAVQRSDSPKTVASTFFIGKIIPLQIIMNFLSTF